MTTIPAAASSSSSPPPPFRRLTYDVFLSFRGTDTRNNFTDHLYTALIHNGIRTFRDDEELVRGESIGPNLLKAIEESRYVIVVVSRNYANSSFCLDEIAKIVDCKKEKGQKVLPVFYDVDPSEVRRQTGDYFVEAFEKHQNRFQGNPGKVKRWRDALSEVGDLSGWHLQNGSEAKVIQQIVQKIFTELNEIISTSEGLVGMDSHLNEMLSYLDFACPDVRIIGIWGMGGVGKTTIAQVVSERVKAQFEGDSFLENVREVTEKQGVVHLQQQLFSNLLKSTEHVQTSKMGKDIIRHRLCDRKVLLILDDVDQDEQLQALCGRTWFGPGSRVIVTSRDEHLLSAFGVDGVYKVKPLTDPEALQLFHMKAFKKDQLVGEDFLKLSKEFLKYCKGLPLAIKVLGSSVNGRSEKLWSSELKRLKKSPNMKIISVLKFSYDGLQETEKKLFLDLACFFKGEDIDRVKRILQGSNDDSLDLDLEVLLEKSMVILFGKKLWMHDLIQELGWELVRQECCQDPGQVSRLGLSNEILHVFDRNKGTSAVQSIFLQRPTKDNVVHSINDSFSNMDRLRLLRIWNVKFSGDIKYLSNELQFLDWHECPLVSLPSDFQPDNLVELHMYSSRIEQLWRVGNGWGMLRLMDLRGSQYLISTPDFSQVPELEILVLADCRSLVEVHPSLGFLKKLFFLNMRNCKSLECIPPFTSLESLKILNLSLCSRLKKFPEIEGDMKSSLEIYLGETSIEELPPSVERLTGLTMLSLRDCKHLLYLPATIQFLTSLKSLTLIGCSNLDKIPENLKSVECLEELLVDGTAIKELSFLVGMKNLRYLSCEGCKGLHHASNSLLLPDSLSSLSCLVQLDLSDCNLMDGSIPDELSSLISLETLDLSGNNFRQLPESISQLSKLETLYVNNCRQLQLLPKLPSSCRHVDARGCPSLPGASNQFKVLTSIESGVTTVNYLDSRGDLESFKGWSHSTDAQGSCDMSFGMREDKHSEWEEVGHLSVPVTTLLKDIELSDDLSNSGYAVFVDNEIPEWFSSVTTNNPISIQIPPNLTDDNKWKGVAACAVFSFKGRSAISLVEPDSKSSSYSYQCSVETDIFYMEPSIFDREELLRVVRSSSHILLIFYLPSYEFGTWLNGSTVMSAGFGTNNPFMEVQKCGIRLVYEQDAGWLAKLFPGSIAIYLNDVQDATLKPGWLSQVDKCLKWENFIPPREQVSTILLRKNIESVLPRYLEALNHNSAIYKFNLRESPAWFESFNCTDTTMTERDSTHTRPGSSVSIKLPQNLYKTKKWMGFAIYASIAEDQLEKVQEEYHVHLQLKMGGCYKDLSQKFKYTKSEEHHQLLIVYVPRTQIPLAFTQTSTEVMNISFRTTCPGVEVQRSGVRIVYQEDLQEFVETIIQCMQREDTVELYDKLVVEKWIKLIRLQGHLKGIYAPNERDPRTRRERKFQLLSEKYRNWDWSAPSFFGCVFYGAEIPRWKWFMHFNQGNSAEVELPPNVFDDANWLGIAVCALYWQSHEDPNIIGDSTTPDLEFNVLSCCLDSDVASDGLFDVKFERVLKKLKPWEFASDFSFFFYISRIRYLKFWRQCNLARVTFSSSSPCLGLHSCSLRLVFKKDIEDLVQTLTLCELP